jgi:hypothetical protein
MSTTGSPITQLEALSRDASPDAVRLPVPRGHEEFTVAPAKSGAAHVLVTPTRFKHRWRTSELWYRSAILALDGTVLSMGLPKFRNLGEDDGESASFTRAIECGEDVLFTEKMDGSLAIRSVIDGNIVWRTRGTFDGGTEHGPAIRTVAERYPVLANPSFMAGHSLHFEFVHPAFQIVIRYDRPDLVLLSAVRHADLTMATYEQLAELSMAHDLNLVGVHELPRQINELRASVDAFEGVEGIVARYGAGEQQMIKLKGVEYLRQHRLNFSFGLRETLRVCQEEDFASVEQFTDHLYALAMDWEVIQTKLPIYEVWARARAAAHAELAEARSFVDAYGSLVDPERIGERTRAHARLDDRAARAEYVDIARKGYGEGTPGFSGAMAISGGESRASGWFESRLRVQIEQALAHSRLDDDA